MKKHLETIDIVDIQAIEREAAREAAKERQKQYDLKRAQGDAYVHVAVRNKEDIVRERYIERSQAGMQQQIDQRWIDREHHRLLNDIIMGKAKAPPGFMEKYGPNRDDDEY